MAELRSRKRIRLDPEVYADPGNACSITIATINRTPFFRNNSVAVAVLDALRQRARATGVKIHAYCLMPDHCHLVCEPSPGTDIVTFVGGFKSLSRRFANQAGAPGPIWQRSFFDHFLRREEQLEDVARYVLENPIRAGLVEDWRQYSLCGSFTLDVSDV
jgi:putative transposase